MKQNVKQNGDNNGDDGDDDDGDDDGPAEDKDRRIISYSERTRLAVGGEIQSGPLVHVHSPV